MLGTRAHMWRVALAAAGTVALGALAACGAAPSTHATTVRSSPAATSTPSSPTWTVVTNVPAQTVSMVFAPSNPQTVYLCALDGPAASPVPQTPRLHKSMDGGQTWNLLTAAPPLHPVPATVSGPHDLLANCAVFVDATDANDVFYQQVELEPVGATFAVLRTLYRSRDGGASWSQLGTIPNSDGFTSLYVVGGRLIGIYKPSVLGASPCDHSVTPKAGSSIVASDDGGATWHDTTTSIEGTGFSVSELAAAGDTLIAAGSHVPPSACTYPTQSAIWRSTDGGRTWSVAQTLTAAYLGPLAFAPAGAGSAAYGVVTATPVANISNQVLYATSDGGATWAQLPLDGSAYFPLSNGDILCQSATGTSIDRLRLSDPHPAWSAVAPGADGTWQVETSNGVTRLWSVSFQYGGQSTVQYLTLPG
jgi:photosystem II stability/assembly factor-like uncharacterized protein